MAVDAGHELEEALSRWQVDAAAVRERMYRAPTPRERERWHALWLALQGWSTARVATALGRDPHTVGRGLAALRRDGPATLAFAHTGVPPRPAIMTTPCTYLDQLHPASPSRMSARTARDIEKCI